jgi:thiol-disulfide isomerase/thioredoxin
MRFFLRVALVAAAATILMSLLVAAAASAADASVAVLAGEEEFNKVVLDTNKHVFVFFGSAWCAHCHGARSEWEKLATVYNAGKAEDDETRVVFAEFEASRHEPITHRYNVRGFPTFMLFKKNKKGHDDGAIFHWAREVPRFTQFLDEELGGKK